MPACRKNFSPKLFPSESEVGYFPYFEEKDKTSFELLRLLSEKHHLSLSSYEKILEERTEADEELAHRLARECTEKYYGRGVYTRGLIEFTNYCKNNCHYCGIQRGNQEVERYRLSKEEILSCCEEGYRLGFRTFVLQGGEDPYFTDEKIVEIVQAIKKAFPDCAVTLSIGEKSRASYEKYFLAGADRYLLRHETADKEHYQYLHPKELSWEHRMRCLKDLKDIGFQVGCGFMVGSPHQTAKTLAKDLYFIQEFQPDMCGIGPFIPQHATVFAKETAGTLHDTLFLLSLLRLIHPNMLIPATTALGTIDKRGRELGILSGANVLMPNLSPTAVRKKYLLYDNKICTGDESAQCRACLSRRMESIGAHLLVDRGDVKKITY